MAGNQKYCPSCGTPNPAEVFFCFSCGKKFPILESQQPVINPAAVNSPVQPISGMPPIPQPAQSDFITLSCPNCGGRLQITSDLNRFACQYCGHEHIVRRDGGIISLEPVMQMMGQINTNLNTVGAGVYRLSGNAERQASEAAILRLKEEIAAANKKIVEDRKNTSSMWWLVPGFAGAGLLINFIFSFMPDVGYNLGILFGFIKWTFIIGTGLIFIAAISTSSFYKKDIAKQIESIRQKEIELNQHYQVVSNNPWKN